jgi:hypothetical protein
LNDKIERDPDVPFCQHSSKWHKNDFASVYMKRKVRCCTMYMISQACSNYFSFSTQIHETICNQCDLKHMWGPPDEFYLAARTNLQETELLLLLIRIIFAGCNCGAILRGTNWTSHWSAGWAPSDGPQKAYKEHVFPSTENRLREGVFVGRQMRFIWRM